MSTMIEAAEVMGIGLACALGGASLVVSLMTRKVCINKARRVARAEARHQEEWFERGVSIRLARLEGDGRTHEMALKANGLMEAGAIVVRNPPDLTIHRPDEENDGGEAA